MLRVLLGFALLLIGCLCSLSMSTLYIFGTAAPSAAFAESVFCGSEGHLIDGTDAPAFGFAQVPACDSPEPEKAGSLAGRITLYIGISIALMVFGSLFLFGAYVSWKYRNVSVRPYNPEEEGPSLATKLRMIRIAELSQMLSEGRISEAEYQEEMRKADELYTGPVRPSEDFLNWK